MGIFRPLCLADVGTHTEPLQRVESEPIHATFIVRRALASESDTGGKRAGGMTDITEGRSRGDDGPGPVACPAPIGRTVYHYRWKLQAVRLT